MDTCSANEANQCAKAMLDAVPAVMNEIRSAMREQVGESITIPQFRAVAFVSRAGVSNVSEIADFMGVTLPSASVLVERLVRLGLLNAAQDELDRRRTSLSVSSAGEERLRSIRSGARRRLSAALQHYSSAEIATLQQAFVLLSKNFHHSYQK